MLALVMLLSITACAESVSPRVLPLEGYDMVEVPTDVISYDSELVMTYIQEFANFTQVPRPSYNTIQMAEYLQVWAALGWGRDGPGGQRGHLRPRHRGL